MSGRLVLVGGGLANSLIAYRFRNVRPEVDLVVLERDGTLGGNHIWCFHQGDLSPDQQRWVAPLVEWSWPGYDVHFPDRRRRLTGGYRALSCSRLDRVVRQALGDRARLRCEVTEVAPGGVRLSDGSFVRADAVIDGRGFAAHPSLSLAYQKFLGRVIELDRAHTLSIPILMDATVEQRDGYRFVYTLPLGERSLLVEDTRYTEDPTLDREELSRGIQRYIEAQRWQISRVTREEEGVLPIVLAGDLDAFWLAGEAGLPRSGLRAALFHPTTGYSLPEAVRLADLLVEQRQLTSDRLYDVIRERARRRWRGDGFYRMLNRMLFRAEPAERYRQLERFYGLPEPLIDRFYAGRSTLGDRLRILTGRPPIPIRRALECIREPRTPA